MARKGIWMLVLLVALLALSVAAAFAADLTRAAEASLVPQPELATADGSGEFDLLGLNGASHRVTNSSTYDFGECNFDKGAAAAY
jgi:hypothetical protein